MHAAVTCLVGEAMRAATARAARGALAIDAGVLARIEGLLAQMRDNAM